MLLLAPEALGPQVACVEDALRARGFDVRVALGHRARRWVRRVPPGPPGRPWLRVLCVPEIDPALAERLRQGRDDFHIVGLDAPLSVVREIERVTGRVPRHRRPRPSRAYLAQPTLIEQQLAAQRSWGWVAVAGVALLAVGVAGGMMLGPSRAEPVPVQAGARAPANAVKVAAPAMHRREEPVLSAVAPIEPEVIEGPDEHE